jgi:hypothetical protein
VVAVGAIVVAVYGLPVRPPLTGLQLTLMLAALASAIGVQAVIAFVHHRATQSPPPAHPPRRHG